MGHFVAPTVTAGPTPEIHAGLNYNHSTYTLSETLSGSTTIHMMALPPGARVVDATLSFDNDALHDTVTKSSGVALQIRTGTNIHGWVVGTSSMNSVVNTYSPNYAAVGYRTTASSHLTISFHDSPAGSGTATTIFSVAVAYDCQLEGD